MRILIIGAGIGGLATALRLHDAGIETAMYEQGERVRELGVGINLLPNAVGELVEAWLLDELTSAGVRTKELSYAHRLGRRSCIARAGWTPVSRSRRSASTAACSRAAGPRRA